jgi:hypothetical protein
MGRKAGKRGKNRENLSMKIYATVAYLYPYENIYID